jgi:hypothetical protein
MGNDTFVISKREVKRIETNADYPLLGGRWNQASINWFLLKWTRHIRMLRTWHHCDSALHVILVMKEEHVFGWVCMEVWHWWQHIFFAVQLHSHLNAMFMNRTNEDKALYASDFESWAIEMKYQAKPCRDVGQLKVSAKRRISTEGRAKLNEVWYLSAQVAFVVQHDGKGWVYLIHYAEKRWVIRERELTIDNIWDAWCKTYLNAPGSTANGDRNGYPEWHWYGFVCTVNRDS